MLDYIKSKIATDYEYRITKVSKGFIVQIGWIIICCLLHVVEMTSLLEGENPFV